MLPRRRKPSPTGKVAGPKALTDEGPHPKNETSHIEWRTLPFNVACFSLFGCFPSSGPGCARSTFPVGEGCLPAGAFPYLPLGEGAAAAAEEGRYQVGHCTAPHPSGLRPATLSQERVGGPRPDRAYENVYRICLRDGVNHW